MRSGREDSIDWLFSEDNNSFRRDLAKWWPVVGIVSVIKNSGIVAYDLDFAKSNKTQIAWATYQTICTLGATLGTATGIAYFCGLFGE
ncbi:MAG: hypothetical protein WC796_01390 [Candidatus Pacearchaeota archaeon]|jgi:hypothetical protein